MRKPNYQQARKQKELSRKARQQEKQQRRVVGKEPDGDSPQSGAPEGSNEGSSEISNPAAAGPSVGSDT
jgi:hypothetical protein